MNRPVFLLVFLVATLVFCAPWGVNAAIQDEIEARNHQIEELQRQIEEYQKQIDENSQKAVTLSGEISRLNASINKVQLEIRSLSLAIDQTSAGISTTQGQIEEAKNKIELHKRALARGLRFIYEIDKENLTSVLLKNVTLAGFFNNLQNLEDTQKNLQTAILDIRNLKSDLEQKEIELEEQRGDLEGLKRLQETEKRSLDYTRGSKDTLLKETKGQESKFQELVKRSKQDIEKIREQVFYLQQNGVTVEEAIKFGQLAAIRVGVRPAFLIAVLEVESGLGRNVGTGNWLNDMYQCYLRLKKPERAEAEKAAFFEIVSKLALDPNSVKVSREPNYGCGGALGPAQFLPTTWLAYEEEVANLTGHRPPNPWDIEDAFMAAAVKLARGGAAKGTRAGEIAASKAYISGRPTCSSSICNYYANAVQNKAAIIEQNL